MSSSDDPFRFKISSKNVDDKKIPLSVISNGFQKIQALIYILGDQIEGNQYRTAGNYPNQIKERYELALSSLDIGSADSYIVPASPFHSSDGLPSPAENAISLMTQIITIISHQPEDQSSIIEIIPDEQRRRRFTRELMDLWPDEGSEYTYEIAKGSSPLTPLLPEKRSELLRIHKPFHSVEETRELFGRIISLHVDEKRKILIETPDGEITGHYSPEGEDDLKGFLGSFVHFEAVLTLHKGKFIVEVINTTDIEPFDEFPLEYAVINHNKRALKTPLMVSMEYCDNHYHLENQEFLIEAYATRLKGAMELILDQLELLYQEYCTGDPNDLTPDAQKLRSRLLFYFGE